MKFGIHLPHAGEQATPALIRRHAERAEALGLDDVWVSEHIIVPKSGGYPPSPNFWDPVLTLTWAAACKKLGATKISEEGENQQRSPGGLNSSGVGGVQILSAARQLDCRVTASSPGWPD